MFKHFLFGCSTSSIQKCPLAIQLFSQSVSYLFTCRAFKFNSLFFIVIIIIIVKILRNFCEYNPLLGSMTGHFLHLISLVTQEKEANLTDSDF